MRYGLGTRDHERSHFLGLLDHYPKDHTDFEDCLAARDRLGETLLEGLSIINQAVRIEGGISCLNPLRFRYLKLIRVQY